MSFVNTPINENEGDNVNGSSLYDNSVKEELFLRDTIICALFWYVHINHHGYRTMHSVYLLIGAKEQRLALTELYGSSIFSMLIIRLLIMEVAV